MSTTTLSPLPSVAELVELLKTAFPFPYHWQNHVRTLGISAGTKLSPTEMTALTDRVFWIVKQSSIKDPAGWIASRRAQSNATRTPIADFKRGTSREAAGGVRVGKNSDELGPGELGPGELGQSVAKTCGLAPPVPTHETTKADVLRRAKAAIDAGEKSLRDAAEALALAETAFNASQREIAEAIGRSASWVNRLLKWHRSGYKEGSPFGPTTQAARVAHAKRASMKRTSKPAATTTSAEVKSSEMAANATAASSRTPSPAVAKRNLMDAIDQWWPYMDSAGKGEVTSFFLQQTAGT